MVKILTYRMEKKSYTITDFHKLVKDRRDFQPATILLTGNSDAERQQAVEEIAASLNRKVTRINLSGQRSRYIGETEKNLAKIFENAESAGNVLFFDEAEALFGKRTKVQDAHDKYANAEASYLLERASRFDGVIVYAARAKGNLDDAFMRRLSMTVSAGKLPG
jgi:SpoVK/Ycf46/Vps4 family AAA+-type ATPase